MESYFLTRKNPVRNWVKSSKDIVNRPFLQDYSLNVYSDRNITNTSTLGNSKSSPLCPKNTRLRKSTGEQETFICLGLRQESKSLDEPERQGYKMPDKKQLCQPETYSVLIPYKDLERLVNFAENQEKAWKEMETLKKRLAALQKIYMEILERLDEIYNSL